MTPKRDLRPAIPIAVLTEAETGRRVFVNGLWCRTFGEADRGTLVTFNDGATLAVEEDFMTVAELFGRGFAGL